MKAGDMVSMIALGGPTLKRKDGAALMRDDVRFNDSTGRAYTETPSAALYRSAA